MSVLAEREVSPSGTAVTGTAWSPWPPEFQYGSGGGISLLFPQPDYQAGVVPNAVATTTTTADGQTITFRDPARVIPDISLVGDPAPACSSARRSRSAVTRSSMPAARSSEAGRVLRTALGGTSLSRR